MAKEFLKARTSVPSRAHPMAPQSGGLLQKAAGMQAKLHDKVSLNQRTHYMHFALRNLDHSILRLTYESLRS